MQELFWLKRYGGFFWLNLDFIQPNPQIYQGPSELKGQTPFTFEWSANFLQKYCVWSPRSPLNMLNIVVPDSNSSSTVFFPGHQITAAWVWQCSHLSTYKPVGSSSFQIMAWREMVWKPLGTSTHTSSTHPVNHRWWLLLIILCFIYLEMDSKRMGCLVFPGSKVKCINL